MKATEFRRNGKKKIEEVDDRQLAKVDKERRCRRRPSLFKALQYCTDPSHKFDTMIMINIKNTILTNICSVIW